MIFSTSILDFLNKNARRPVGSKINANDDLFKMGAIDSFGLFDLVSMLQDEFAIEIPDADVTLANFQTLASIEKYLETKKG